MNISDLTASSADLTVGSRVEVYKRDGQIGCSFIKSNCNRVIEQYS